MPRMATYRAVMLTKKGGPEVLETVELPLEAPKPGEARVKVRACGVGATDIIMRTGYYPYAPKVPFVPGYDVVGDVEAVGPGVTAVKVGDRVCCLAVHGGYAEVFTRGADELVAVPPGLDDAEVVALILNYMTAYQMIHRVANQKAGETALVTGANGGVGQALCELLRLIDVKVYGAASKRAHDLVRALGAIPIEGGRESPIDEALHVVCPDGVDASYDALGGKYVAQCIDATHKKGHVVAYGFSSTTHEGKTHNLEVAHGYLSTFVTSRLSGRKGSFYGITQWYRKDRAPFVEDMPKLFALLAAKKIQPKIAARLGLLDARKGNEMLEKGGVDGKIVLVAQ
jgi:NADPH:quinone reductase-like Zn-dependent oxidoreductase